MTYAPMMGGMVEFQLKRRIEIAQDGRVATGTPPTFPFGRNLAQVAEDNAPKPKKPPYAGHDDE